jgi:RTA1 like protein
MSRGFLSPSFSVSSNFTIRKLETNKKVALGFATIAIITRSIFRAIELSNGFSGALANNEVLYMILEPPMISLAVIALSLSPWSLLPRKLVQCEVSVQGRKREAAFERLQ